MASAYPAEFTVSEGSDTDEVVCHCLQVRRSEIKTVADQETLVTVRCIMKQTDAGTGCTACHAHIRRLLAEHAAETQSSAARLQHSR